MQQSAPLIKVPELVVRPLTLANNFAIGFSVIDTSECENGELVVIQPTETAANQAVNDLTYNPYFNALLKLKTAAFYDRPIEIVNTKGQSREHVLGAGGTFRIFGPTMRSPIVFTAILEYDGYFIQKLRNETDVDAEFKSPFAVDVIRFLCE
jgi:hypothetical protein